MFRKLQKKVLHKCIFIAVLTLWWQLWVQNQMQRGQNISQKKKLSAFSPYLIRLWNTADSQRIQFANTVRATVIAPVSNTNFPPPFWQEAKLLGIYTNGALILWTLTMFLMLGSSVVPLMSIALLRGMCGSVCMKLRLTNAQFIQDLCVNNLFLHASDDFIAVPQFCVVALWRNLIFSKAIKCFW